MMKKCPSWSLFRHQAKKPSWRYGHHITAHTTAEPLTDVNCVPLTELDGVERNTFPPYYIEVELIMHVILTGPN